MKTFKTFITEREKDVPLIAKQLRSGKLSYISKSGKTVTLGDTYDALQWYLENEWEARVIGKGMYATVLAGSTQEAVIKIIDGVDLKYEKYADLAMKHHKNNSFFPRILDNIIFGKDKVNIYFIESVDIAERVNNSAISYLCTKNVFDMLWMAFIQEAKHGQDLGPFGVADFIKRDMENGTTSQGRALASVNFDVDKFKEWVLIMWDAEFTENMFDLHGQNWGLRKDGSIVLFDPVG